MQDVIYLKDGSILRGEIIEQSDKESVKIVISGSHTLILQRNQIKRISRERKPGAGLYKRTGYVNRTGIHFAPGDLGNSYRFQMVNGYQFNPNFSAGLGLGYSAYEKEPLNAVPLFLDLHYKILRANKTPFVFVKAGYNFSINVSEAEQNPGFKEHHGGTMLNTGIGLHFDVNQNVAWYFTLKYSPFVRPLGWVC